MFSWWVCLLTVPWQFLCCIPSLFERLWSICYVCFVIKCICSSSLFLWCLEKLCFVIDAFTEYLHLYVWILKIEYTSIMGKESWAVLHDRRLFMNRRNKTESAIFVSYITKTSLFKYIENFTSKNWKFSDKNLWYFSNFCSKHRLWVLIRTASARRF